MTIKGNVLTAAEGMLLTNGEIYSERVYLGIHDSPTNWHEISASEIPEPAAEPEADDYIQAARILLGWED